MSGLWRVFFLADVQTSAAFLSGRVRDRPKRSINTRWADEDAPHTRQALSLVWRRFSPPRFKLSAVAEGQAGGGFKPQDIRQVCTVVDVIVCVSPHPLLLLPFLLRCARRRARLVTGNDWGYRPCLLMLYVIPNV